MSSNLVCKNCKSTAVEYEDYCGGTSYYRCKTCGQHGNKDKFTQQTVFDLLTASPEVLAEKLVFKQMYMVQDGILQYWVSSYYSTIIKGRSWEYETEAIAATVARLKEVKNEK